MLLKVRDENALSPVFSDWSPLELQLEDYLVPDEVDEPILQREVFKEELLFVGQQVPTQHNKRLDILALDQKGQGVVIELKRDQGTLGVETQALQYVAEVSGYEGSRFVRMFSEDPEALEDRIQSFTGEDVQLNDVNRQTRVILVARGFDRALPSLCQWLGDQDIPVRCIQYTPIEIDGVRYLDFSIDFDSSPRDLFPLVFGGRVREPKVFWFNIGRSRQEWWTFLREAGKIMAGFENQPGDQGERILRSFVRHDRIIAYASGFGAVGWAEIEEPGSYELIEPGSPDDFLDGEQLHHLKVKWRSTAERLDDAISAGSIREQFDLHHPIATRVRVDGAKGTRLIRELDRRFGK